MLRRVGTIAVTAIVGLLAFATPARAEVVGDDPDAGMVIMDTSCADNHVCLWEGYSFGGDKWVDYTVNSLPDNKFNIGGWNGDNEISSAKNETDLILVLWDNDNYTGTRACIPANSSSSNLGQTHGFNDRAESFQLRGTC